MGEWLFVAAGMLGAGCVAGVLAGLFGIGGGIVIVPVLEVVLQLMGVDAAIRMHVAVATSLAVIVPTSIASARAHHARGAVDLDVARRWGGFVLGGALLGTWIAARLESESLALVFATLAGLVALKMLFDGVDRRLTDSVPRHPATLLLPTSIGTASTMMGIGGGTFSVIVLTLFGQPIHRAVGTAALFGLVIAVPGVVGFVAAGWGDPRLPSGSIGFVNAIGFACIAPATVMCAPLGARIAHAFPAALLGRLFGGFLLLAAARMYYGALS